MRIEMKDETQEEVQPRKSDRLEDKYESDLTRKEKRLLEKQKLEGMGFGKKLEYIWMYYKAVIFGILGVIFAIYMGVDIYHNAQIETILSMFVVSGNVDDGLMDELKEFLGSEDELEEVSVSTNLQANETLDGFDYYSQMLFMAQMQTGVDILIMPEGLYENLSGQEYFEDLHVILGEEGYAAMGDLAQGDCLKVDSSILGDEILTVYDTACIAVGVTAKNPENAAKWMLSLVE